MRKAFTLIELLVVLAIITILAALLMPALVTARESAIMMQCMTRMRQMSLAVAFYENDFDDVIPEHRFGFYNSCNVGPEFGDEGPLPGSSDGADPSDFDVSPWGVYWWGCSVPYPYPFPAGKHMGWFQNQIYDYAPAAEIYYCGVNGQKDWFGQTRDYFYFARGCLTCFNGIWQMSPSGDQLNTCKPPPYTPADFLRVGTFDRQGVRFAVGHINQNPDHYYPEAYKAEPLYWGFHKMSMGDWIQTCDMGQPKPMGTEGYIFMDNHVEFLGYVEARCWMGAHIVDGLLTVGWPGQDPTSTQSGCGAGAAIPHCLSPATWCDCQDIMAPYIP